MNKIQNINLIHLGPDPRSDRFVGLDPRSGLLNKQEFYESSTLIEDI